LEKFRDRCFADGDLYSLSTVDGVLAVSEVLQGNIRHGIRLLQDSILKRNAEACADWYRLFLCEIYLQIIGGSENLSFGTLLRNLPILLKMLGMVTAGPYSAAHDSAVNKAYVAAFENANNFRPNFVSLAGYDGMHLIYEALKKTGGNSDGAALLAAMRGMAWDCPRGPMSIDPQTRDVVNNIHIRKVEKINGQLYNAEFATYEAVKDPLKSGTT